MPSEGDCVSVFKVTFSWLIHTLVVYVFFSIFGIKSISEQLLEMVFHVI